MHIYLNLWHTCMHVLLVMQNVRAHTCENVRAHVRAHVCDTFEHTYLLEP